MCDSSSHSHTRIEIEIDVIFVVFAGDIARRRRRLLFFSPFRALARHHRCSLAVVVEQNGKFPIGYEIRIGIREHIYSRQTLVIVHTTEKLNGPSNRSIHLSLFFHRLRYHTNQFSSVCE